MEVGKGNHRLWNFFRSKPKYDYCEDFDIDSHCVTKSDSQNILEPSNIIERIPCYKMDPALSSICIIFNISEFKDGKPNRPGAESDEKNLIELFNSFNYQTYVFHNISAPEYDSIVEKFRTSHFKNNSYNSLIFIVISHGLIDPDGHKANVEFSDNKFRNCFTTVEKFNNKNCTSLIGKPKIFFFLTSKSPELDNIGKIHKQRQFEGQHEFTDTLIVFSQMPVYQKFGNEGSFFVTEMCNVLTQYGHDTHMEDLLKIINCKIIQNNGNSFADPLILHINLGFFKLFFLSPINEI